jgi:hypothetical protein
MDVIHLIYKNFKEAISEYGISTKICKIVTDGGTNIVKAFRSFAELHESTLQNEVINSISNTIDCVLMNTSIDNHNNSIGSDESISSEEDKDNNDKEAAEVILGYPFFCKHICTKLEYDFSKIVKYVVQLIYYKIG